MPGEKKQYEICREAQTIVDRLCVLYPNKFGHIDPNSIGCVMIANKEKSESQDDCKTRGVKEPDSIFCSKRYILEFYKNIWDLYDAGQRSGMLYKQLERIPDKDEGPDGSVEKLSLQDSMTLVSQYGVEYMDDGKLPDLAAEKIDGLDG